MIIGLYIFLIVIGILSTFGMIAEEDKSAKVNYTIVLSLTIIALVYIATT